ncbi:MAG: hypothetical protein PGN13_16100 [Patulibacter minatonensis]
MAEPSPGPIVLSTDIERAVRDTLKHWVAFYLADIDEQHDRERGTTVVPRYWSIASESGAKWLEETPPALVVACPGTMDAPVLHGKDAHYGAWWRVNIGVTAKGASEDGARDIASRYAGAVRYVLGQQGTMGGLVERTAWLGEATAEVKRERSLMAAEVSAAVFVSNVMQTRGLLPRVRPTDPKQPAEPTPTPSRVVIRTVPRSN